MDLSPLVTAVQRRRRDTPVHRSLLVGLSGIDGAGKGFVTASLGGELDRLGLRVAILNVDGWLNLPSTRFSRVRPAEHFYMHALRLEAMFRDLVLPLCRHRAHRLLAALAEETAMTFREHLYEFHDIDVVLLEGTCIYKRAYRHHFDLAVWIDWTGARGHDSCLRDDLLPSSAPSLSRGTNQGRQLISLYPTTRDSSL